MTKLYIIDTDSIDRSKENAPSFHKVYITENPDCLWKDEFNEIPTMKSILRKSKLLQRSKYGVFICNSDLGGGYTNLFEFNSKNYLWKQPLLLRNINLETSRLQERRIPNSTGEKTVPTINSADISIANFENELLIEEGPEAFKEKWCPEYTFKI